MLMIAQQIASKAVRDAFFLAAFDVTSLPIAAVAAAVLSFLAALVLGRVMRDFPPAASVPAIFAINALFFLFEAHLIDTQPRWVAGILYLHTAAFSGAVVSGFWSVINERFDPYTAKSVMGRVAGGATIGGMLGGGATWLVAGLTPSHILLGLCIINGLCSLLVGAVGYGEAKRSSAASSDAGLLDGVRVLVGQPYPRAIALLVLVMALCTACFDYAFKAEVSAEARGGPLVGFFAVFYAITGIATFLVQVVGSRGALKWLGVIGTVALLPTVAAGFLLTALVAPGVWTLVLLRASTMVVENSLYRSGYELLYTPVPLEQKRSAKILVDLGCDRLGTAAGSGLVLLAVAAAANAADRLLVVVSLLLALGTLALLMMMVRREYIQALATRIRLVVGQPATEASANLDYQRVASTFAADAAAFPLLLDGDAPSSGKTTRSLSAGGQGLSRQQLLASIREHARERSAAELSPAAFGPNRVSEQLLTTPLLSLLARAVEEAAPGPLWAELRASAPGTIGQLTDILLSTRHELALRLLAADLLSTVPTERTVAGLTTALTATEFRIRRASAIALLRVCSAAPELRPSKQRLLELAGLELLKPTPRALCDARIERASNFRTDARGAAIAPSLEQVFTLLAIFGDPAALRLALTAVTSPDPGQRGTGLEYLDNLLPLDVRSRLVALVEDPEQIQQSAGFPQAVVAELSAELRSGKVRLSELRARFRKAKRLRYEAAGSEGGADEES